MVRLCQKSLINNGRVPILCFELGALEAGKGSFLEASSDRQGRMKRIK